MTQQITGSEGCVVYSVDSYHLRACLSSFIVKPEKKLLHPSHRTIAYSA